MRKEQTYALWLAFRQHEGNHYGWLLINDLTASKCPTCNSNAPSAEWSGRCHINSSACRDYHSAPSYLPELKYTERNRHSNRILARAFGGIPRCESKCANFPLV